MDERPREDQKNNCRRAKEGHLPRFKVRMAVTSCCHGRSLHGTLEDKGPHEDQKHNCRRAEQHQLTGFKARISSCHGRSPPEGLIHAISSRRQRYWHLVK